MVRKKFTLALFFIISLLLLSISLSLWGQEITRTGADSCLLCHGEGSENPVNDIFKTKHASRFDPNSPFSNLQCESCHGPAAEHAAAQRKGESENLPVHFGSDSITSAEKQNEVCLSCHKTEGRLAWHGSMHELEELSCASCHQIHVDRDPIFDELKQQEVCFGCHQKKRADVLKPSSHPLRFGDLSCSDCHDPHDGNNDFLLKQSTVNDTCYSCHAEKRGPFLWEHAPASEDCTLCHKPHGSNQPALLVRRPPLLCQQCHSPAGHPSVALTSGVQTDEFNSRFLLGRACLNCHSQIHGSNHPSGSKLHR